MDSTTRDAYLGYPQYYLCMWVLHYLRGEDRLHVVIRMTGLDLYQMLLISVTHQHKSILQHALIALVLQLCIGKVASYSRLVVVTVDFKLHMDGMPGCQCLLSDTAYGVSRC